jgi:shikimate kinase
MSAILVGYRGSGKTTVGRKLADRLWLKFVDTDELVVAAAGKSIKDIFENDGEARFRELEDDAVQKVCAMQDHVISMGGGAVVKAENRKAIKDSGFKCVYLRCEPAVLLQRIQADPQTAATRPALTKLAGSVEEIKTLLASREPLYREVMTAELDVTHLTPDEAMVYLTRLL